MATQPCVAVYCGAGDAVDVPYTVGAEVRALVKDVVNALQATLANRKGRVVQTSDVNLWRVSHNDDLYALQGGARLEDVLQQKHALRSRDATPVFQPGDSVWVQLVHDGACVRGRGLVADRRGGRAATARRVTLFRVRVSPRPRAPGETAAASPPPPSPLPPVHPSTPQARPPRCQRQPRRPVAAPRPRRLRLRLAVRFAGWAWAPCVRAFPCHAWARARSYVCNTGSFRVCVRLLTRDFSLPLHRFWPLAVHQVPRRWPS